MDNNIAESDESFEVFLKLIPNNPYDVKIGEPSVVTVTIYDNEVPSKTFHHGLLFYISFLLLYS